MILRLTFLSFLFLAFTLSATPDFTLSILEEFDCSQLAPCRPEDFEIPSDQEVIQKNGPKKSLQISATTPFYVTVWNVYKGQRHALLKDLKTLAKKSDFLLLQETLLNQPFMNFFDGSPFSWTTAVSFLFRGTPTGVSTASLYQTRNISFLRSIDREPLVKTPKMTLFVEVPIQGTPSSLLIANIHGLNFVPKGSFKKQIRRVFKKLQQHQGPILFGGDFNTWSQSRENFLLELAEKIQLKHIHFPNDLRYRPLDHVFVKGLKPLEAKLLKTIGSSDHIPLFIKFSFDQKI